MTESSQQRYYSPSQIGVAAFLGSPLASGYLAFRNYSLFHAQSKGTLALVGSVVVLAIQLSISYSLPNDSPGFHLAAIVAAVIAALYRWHAQVAFGSQITQLRAEGATSYSWWRVIGLSLAIFVALLVVAYFVLLFFASDAA